MTKKALLFIIIAAIVVIGIIVYLFLVANVFKLETADNINILGFAFQTTGLAVAIIAIFLSSKSNKELIESIFWGKSKATHSIRTQEINPITNHCVTEGPFRFPSQEQCYSPSPMGVSMCGYKDLGILYKIYGDGAFGIEASNDRVQEKEWIDVTESTLQCKEINNNTNEKQDGLLNLKDLNVEYVRIRIIKTDKCKYDFSFRRKAL